MDSENGNSCSSGMKTPKLKSFSGSASPMHLARQNFIIGGQFPQQYHHSNLHTLDPYASSDSRSSSNSPVSPFLQFLRSSSSSSGSGGGWGSGSGSSGSGGGGYLSPMALTSIENFEKPFSRSPTVFKTPVKIEEDVLVMDGILVRSEKSRKLKGSGGQRIRSPLLSFGGRLSSPSSSFSSGKENRSFYKMEKCRAWEEFGTCRFGSRCQFSHAMEELHRKIFLGHSKSECFPQELICKTISSGSCTDGNKSRLDMHKAKFYSSVIEPSPAARVESVEVGSVSPTEPESKSNNANAARADSIEVGYVSPIEPESTSSNVKAARVESIEVGSVSPVEPESTNNKNNIWCPLDDGIQFTFPSASSDPTLSREAINASIDSVVHGLSTGKRLLAFTEFCSE